MPSNQNPPLLKILVVLCLPILWLGITAFSGSNPAPQQSFEFIGVAIHASSNADYNVDPFTSQVAPIDPDIIAEVQKDNGLSNPVIEGNDNRLDVEVILPDDPGIGTPPGDPGTGNPPDDPGTGNPPDEPGDGNPPDDPGTGNPPDDPGTGNPPDGPGNGNPPDNPGNGNGNGNPPDNPGNGNLPDLPDLPDIPGNGPPELPGNGNGQGKNK